LKPVDEVQHSHSRSGEELDDKKKTKVKKENKMIKLKDLITVNEGGMGIQAIVMKNKNKNSKAILKIVMKDSMFKRVDKREMLGYIEGAKMFSKYMKM